MHSIPLATQLALDGGTAIVRAYRWEPGEFAALRDRARRETCATCDRTLRGRATARAAVPVYAAYATEPDTVYICPACAESGQDRESHEWCDGCNRSVYYDTNYTDGGGWRMPTDGELLCARCHETETLTNGHTPEQIRRADDICGIRGDTYTRDQLIERGWTYYPTHRICATRYGRLTLTTLAELAELATAHGIPCLALYDASRDEWVLHTKDAN